MTKRPRAELRSRAKARIARRRKTPTARTLRSAELEIHRVERELQSEDLRLARRLTEAALARYAQVFDFAPSGYAVLDASRQIREINHAGTGLLGAPRAQLDGKRLVNYVSRRGLDAFQALLDQARTAPHSVQTDVEFLRGEEPWLARVTATALPHSSAELLLAFDDITEAKRKETELALSEHALREANQRKDQFLAMLSHELRNPLAPIQNCISAMRLVVPASDPMTRMLDIVERSASQLTRMIEDLLDVTRITSGKIQLQRVQVELIGLVSSAVADVRLAFERRKLQLEARIPGGELWTLGDPVRLTQVLSNLLTNAQKFTPNGGRVTVSLEQIGARAVIGVTDTGIGIEPSQIPALFEPFVQAAQGLDRSRGGLGLGLAVARGILELHGGSIAMHSEGPSRGTEVTFDLPIEPLNRFDERPSAGAASVGKRRVLIIEDHADAATSLQSLLALEGHEVRTASDGTAGLALARTFDPDVVLCDLGLPVMDGFEVARAIRADPVLRDRRVVAITGYAQPEDIARSRSAGFDSHLAKPVTLASLKAELAWTDRSGGGG